MPKHVELPAEELTELGQLIVEDWEDDNDDRQQWLDDLPKWLAMYQNRPVAKDEPWEGASNLFVPVTATVIDTAHPRYMAALFKPEPIAAFQPQDPSDEEYAKKQEQFLDWAVREDCALFPIMDRVLLSACVVGTQPVKVTWDLQIRHVRDRHEFPPDTPLQEALQAIYQAETTLVEAVQRTGGSPEQAQEYVVMVAEKGKRVVEVEKTPTKVYVFTERNEVVRDAPLITYVNPEDFCVESDAPADLQRADHVTHRYWLTLDQIKRECRKGTFRKLDKSELEDLELLEDPSKAPDTNTSGAKEVREAITGAAETQRVGTPSRIELLDSYRKYDVNDDGYDEEIIGTVVKEKPDIVLRVNRLEEVYRHGMRPFVTFGMFPVADAFWSVGYPFILDGLQAEINTIHNQRIDAGTIGNTPYGWYQPQAGLPAERVPLEPGVMIPVDDVNAVKMAQPADYTAWRRDEERVIWDLIEKRTKVNDITMGRPGDTQGASRTATGVQQLASQSAIGNDLQVRRIQEDFKRLLTQILALYRQYMPPGREVRIRGALGAPDVVVTRDDLSKLLDLKFTGNSLSTDREIERNTFSFFAQGPLGPNVQGFLMQMGVMTPQGIAEWYRQLLKVFDVPNIERIIQAPPQPAARNPDEVLGRVLAGEDVLPMPGENHQVIVDKLGRYLQSPDAVGLAPEVRLVAQHQLQARQQAAMQEMLAQQMQQMMMAAQPQPQPGLPAGVGGGPTQVPRPPQPGGLTF